MVEFERTTQWINLKIAPHIVDSDELTRLRLNSVEAVESVLHEIFAIFTFF